MAQELKVVAIPPSEVRFDCRCHMSHSDKKRFSPQFYCQEHVHIGEKFARFAFVSFESLNRIAAMKIDPAFDYDSARILKR